MMIKILLWTPRILAILFTLFLSLFALDVFSMEGNLWMKIGGFLIHLTPCYLLLIALTIAWKQEWLGAILFIGLGAIYLFYFGENFPWQVKSIIAGPAIMIGLLFLLNAILHRHPVS